MMTERSDNSFLDSRGKPRVQTMFHDESLTVQSDAHLADINKIMGTFLDEGTSLLDEAELVYADVSEFTDLADALHQARDAEIDFLKLPSKVREIFDHDVAVWLDTAFDDDKRARLVEAGFIKPDKEVVTARATAPEAEAVPAVAEPSGGGDKVSGGEPSE